MKNQAFKKELAKFAKLMEKAYNQVERIDSRIAGIIAKNSEPVKKVSKPKPRKVSKPEVLPLANEVSFPVFPLDPPGAV